MDLLEHYYLFFLSAFSSKIGDLFTMLLSTVFHCFLWEIRHYYSNNLPKKTECERLLAKITETYLFCTDCRMFVNSNLTPTGFVVGNTGYLAYIEINRHNHHTTSQYTKTISYEVQQFTITLYGWWTIRDLLTPDIVSKPLVGNYKIVGTCVESNFIKTTDNYDDTHLHANCEIGSQIILNNYNKRDCGVYFLFGEPGLGKTTTARHVARQLNAWLCLDFEEFTNYDNTWCTFFESLYNYVQPSKFAPLVIVLDELEDFLFSMKRDTIENEQSMMERETDGNNVIMKYRNTKKRWSRLIDTVQQKKHVIFILTTNKDKSFFDAVDTALLREYRISLNLHYKKKGVDTIPFETIQKRKDKLRKMI